MNELSIGDRIKDNDPRMHTRSALTIIEILPHGVAARDPHGRTVILLRRRIFTDGKPRRSGFSLVVEPK